MDNENFYEIQWKKIPIFSKSLREAEVNLKSTGGWILFSNKKNESENLIKNLNFNRSETFCIYKTEDLTKTKNLRMSFLFEKVMLKI
ncbi:hypothetical protein [Candidatus Odyssella acanthamoebae]|uniref:Uncharacterized protein n=1 Tax=Candidatus Odyssella acanthamoebae TaxID=91604 RepID=A0A077AVF8_9PROT|nr:hypothetical protein [Candidatus Paracaedibacter acanthamoebae]AIK95638.1 hypothetical protein ID47_01085 [Candidatus Paracaedibacter acanthamoebae]